MPAVIPADGLSQGWQHTSLPEKQGGKYHDTLGRADLNPSSNTFTACPKSELRWLKWSLKRFHRLEILGLCPQKAVIQFYLGGKIKNKRADEATENKYAAHFQKLDLF